MGKLRTLGFGALALALGLPALANAERLAPITPQRSFMQKLVGLPHSHEVKQVLKNAWAIHSPEKSDKLLLEFLQKNAATLPIHSVLKLAEDASSDDVADEILAYYADTNSTELTVKEVLRLAAAAATTKTVDRILVDFEARNRDRLSADDRARLANAANKNDVRALLRSGKAEAGAWQEFHLGPTELAY